MSAPQITIDLGVIERNTRTVVARCALEGIRVFGVTKGTCGLPHVARAMLRGGVVGIAESRFENIRRLRDSGIDCPVMLLRSPPLSRAEEVVRTIDISLQSEIPVIAEISRVAERLGRIHDIILMVDLGDLREGIWPNDLIPTLEQVEKLPGVRVAGVGTNLSCLGAIIPTRDNLSQLEAHAYKIERITGRHLDWVSGGNSSSLPLLLAGGMPKGINMLRIGEAILQGGRDTFLEEPWSELDPNAFRLSGELLEVKVKPSMPIGISGVDAFGQKPKFVDEGDRLRAIANIGREDVIVEGMTPVNPGVRVIGASSDHLVLDITGCVPPLAVGDRVSFSLTYGAMLTVMTSEYVEKQPMHDVVEQPGHKRVTIRAEGDAAAIVAGAGLPASLRAIGYDVMDSAGQGTLILSLGESRAIAVDALHNGADSGALGLIWFDSRPSLAGDDAALSVLLHETRQRISPENVVLVGLRQADAAEAAIIRTSRMTVFTMVDIDARGMRDVMREAIRIASAGTQGFHVHYAPEVTDLRNWDDGTGGLTVRETHQAMEAIASQGKLVSLSASAIAAKHPATVVATTFHAILSALGKQII
jgi:predicted amino acid racemase